MNTSNKNTEIQNIAIGRKPILELLLHSSKRIKKVYISSNSKLDPKLLLSLNESQIEVVEKDPLLLDEMSSGVRHQGIVAELKKKEKISLEALIKKSLETNKPILCLDEISDPHNLGAILRVAEATQVAGVISTSNRSANFESITVSKTSAGAVEFVDLVTVKNLAQTLKKLSKSGFWIYGTALDERSQDLYETEVLSPTVLIVGSEGKGLRRQTKDLCDTLIHLPMAGCMQSLNVSQATSVLLYELLRRQKSE